MKQLNGSGHRNTFSYVFVRFAVCFVFAGLAYRLFSSSLVQFSPVLITGDAPPFDAGKTSPPELAKLPEIIDDLQNLDGNPTSENGVCDLFMGEWVPDPNGPLYTNDTCYTIEPPQNCMTNGRPDTGYAYWRWSPRGCHLPRFDAKKFLHLMRDKSIAFVGDSIMRNHVQSLLCLLSKGEQAVEVYHDKTYKNRRWSFPSYKVTVSLFWTPFLAKSFIFEDDDGVSSDIIQLHVDRLDSVWTDQYENFDYVIIAGGKWFLKSAVYYENNTVIGCHSCHKENITQLGFVHAYRKVLNSTLKFITSSNHKPYVFLRTTTPDHFENGEWNTGGYCNRTGPFKGGEVELVDVDGSMRKVELEEFERAKALGSKNGVTLKLFDTTFLSLLRPDGHPGVYRTFHPYDGKDKNAKIQNDCLHWCLPGPIDTWNEVMLEFISRSSS